MRSIKEESILNRRIPTIIVLSFMYVFIGLFVDGLIINPLNPNLTMNNIELIVPIVAAVIFGGTVGGSVGASGLVILEIVQRLSGKITAPFEIEIVLQAIAFFAGIWVIGKFSEERPVYNSVFKLIVDPHFWYRLLLDLLSSVLGLVFVYPIIYFLISQVLPITNDVTIEVFTVLFTGNLTIIMLVIPIILVFYELIEVLRHRRAMKLDAKYKDIQLEIVQEGPAHITRAFFDKHAFRIGQWTPIHIRFKHKWKAARSYEIETISTSRIYPHIDNSPVLQEGEFWTHSVYVLPLKQEYVDLKIRLIPSHTKKFLVENKSQTIASLSAETYVRRDTLFVSVIFLSEVIIFLFIFSILWNQILSIISDLVFNQSTQNSELTVPWDTLLVIAVVELIFFIPFLLLMYLWQREDDEDLEIDQLAFSQDIRTHSYTEPINRDKTRFIFKKIFSGVITLAMISLSGYLTLEYWYLSVGDVIENLTGSTELVLFSGGLLLLWTITVVIMKNSYQIISTPISTKFGDDKFVDSIRSLRQFQIYKPNQLYFTIQNRTRLPGLRLVFKGNDSISPPMIELHLAPGESAQFSVGITPMSRGDHDILIVVYPLFDRDGTYIPFEKATPIVYQNIEYKVLGETIIGITKGQMNTLKHIFGWGSLIASTISIANRYVGVEEIVTRWQDTIPWLVTLQVPFVYFYFIFSNRFITQIQAY